jgi:hypothetical protein
MPELIDVLLVSPGTTAGWRNVDADFAQLLSELGLSVAVASSDFRIARHFRRAMPLTDVAEAAAMRWALGRALRRWEPRAIVYSSTQAPMLQPARRLRGAAVRFDALTTVNRPGAANALTHALERRVLRRVAVLVPSGLDPARRVPADVLGRSSVVGLPLPVEGGAPPPHREPIALCYAGNPHKKGLDRIVEAWQRSAGGLRLVVTGLDGEQAHRFLAERRVAEPSAIEWAGVVSPQRFRELTARAELFLSASRFEDYGIAQLEALADGALLVTTPSAGPYEALPIATALDRGLVTDDLGAGIGAAHALGEAERAAYRAEAAELLKPYSRAELERRVSHDLLPLLGLTPA